MDTLASPTASTFSPQISAQRQRSSYRLFPIVEPTPPTSPTTLQKVTLTRSAESHRRRSSSLEKASRFPASSRVYSASHAGLPAHLSSRDGRKISLQESRAVMTTVHEVHSNPPSAGSTPDATTFGARAHPDSNARQRFNSASSQSIPDDTAATYASGPLSPEGDQRQIEGSTVLSLPARHGADSEFPLTPSFQASRFRDKPGPNLRIAVAKEDSDSERDDAPAGPMPPPKSPRYLDDVSTKSPSASSLTTEQQRSRPITPSGGRQSYDAWSSQTASNAPGRAAAPSLTPNRGQPVSEAGAKPSRHHVRQSKPLPPIQLPPVQLSPVRYTPPAKSPSPIDSAIDPRSSHPPVSPLSPRFLTGPATDDGPLPSPMSQFLQPGPHSQPRTLQPLSPSLQNMERLRNAIKTYGVDSPVHDTTSPTSFREPELRAKRSEPVLVSRRPERKPMPSRTHSDSVGSINNEQQNPLRSASSLSNRSDLPDCISRVLAAKANIAALNISDPAPLPSEALERSRSPVPDAAGVNRLVTPGSVQSKTSLSALVDPAATLKELAEQTEALRTRYASLRADRQKLSGNIVAKLQEQKPGPEYANLLLDEQLSLAAVSSSMDICFAKLKALDCRKEDAIAALIAQSSQRTVRGFVPSNVSSVVSYGSASSRKLSMGHSTGRLTSEFGDQPAAQYPARNASYSSEFDASDYQTTRVRHKSSMSSDSGYTLESTDRTAPQMVPEAMQRLAAAPPLTPVHEIAVVATSAAEHDSSEESGMDGATEASKEDDADTETRPSSAAASESKTIEEELLEARPKKIRIDADKAVKILNLLIRSANGKDVPSVKLSGGRDDDDADDDDGVGGARDVEFEIVPPSKPREARKAPVKKSPKSVASPKKSALRSNNAAANTDLDSFPVPNALPILQARKYEAPLPPLPPIPGWQEDSDTLRTTRVADTASDDTMSFKERAKRRGYSAQTIQTIQVYMDDDMTNCPQ